MTHTIVLIIQAAAFLPYTTAFLQIVRRRTTGATAVWIALGLACDVFLGVFASLSGLGENRNGVDWTYHPFVAHVILAGIGMFGFILLFVLLLAFRGRERADVFVRRAAWVVYPCWAVGVFIAIINVFANLY